MKTTRTHWSRASVIVTLAVALAIGCAPRARLSGTVPTDEQIAAAKTKSEHEALAADYAKLADEARSKAEQHTKMGERYRHQHFGPGKGNLQQNPMVGHCRSLAKLYSNVADEYDAMAKEHRAMAAAAH